MPELYKYSYRVLRLDLALGLTDFELPIDARKIVYASPTDGPELSIRLQAKSNDQIPLRPQGEIIAPFQRIYITASAVAKTVQLLIGSPEDIQLTGRDVALSGIISSREPYENAGWNGQLYIGLVSRLPAAGNFSHCELRNPTGSGKTVILLGMVYQNGSVSSTTYEANRCITPLTALIGNPFNAANNGQQSIAEVRTQNNAAYLGIDNLAGLNRRRELVPVTTSGRFQRCFDIIPEGVGIVTIPGVQNVINMTEFHFWEF